MDLPRLWSILLEILQRYIPSFTVPFVVQSWFLSRDSQRVAKPCDLANSRRKPLNSRLKSLYSRESPPFWQNDLPISRRLVGDSKTMGAMAGYTSTVGMVNGRHAITLGLSMADMPLPFYVSNFKWSCLLTCIVGQFLLTECAYHLTGSSVASYVPFMAVIIYTLVYEFLGWFSLKKDVSYMIWFIDNAYSLVFYFFRWIPVKTRLGYSSELGPPFEWVLSVSLGKTYTSF